MTQPTVKSIVGEIGRDNLSRRLGVTEYAIRHALSSGVFPSAWFLAVTEMARDAGVTCPVKLFNFKSPSSDASTDGSERDGPLPSKDVGSEKPGVKGAA